MVFYTCCRIEATCLHITLYSVFQVSYKVYQRLTRLLRSLICMTRDKNGYYLARNQRSDTFVICYRLYHGPPELSEMGDSFNGPTHTHIGSSVTPLGTVRLGVHCRYACSIQCSLFVRLSCAFCPGVMAINQCTENSISTSLLPCFS